MPSVSTRASVTATEIIAIVTTEEAVSALSSRACCHAHADSSLAVCKPKQFNAYCEQLNPPGPAPPTPTPPAPTTCAAAAKQACPGPFDDPEDCDQCVRKSATASAACSHEERKAYCGG